MAADSSRLNNGDEFNASNRQENFIFIMVSRMRSSFTGRFIVSAEFFASHGG